MVIQIVYSLFIEMCLSYKKYYSIFVFCLLLSYIQVHTSTVPGTMKKMSQTNYE